MQTTRRGWLTGLAAVLATPGLSRATGRTSRRPRFPAPRLVIQLRSDELLRFDVDPSPQVQVLVTALDLGPTGGLGIAVPFLTTDLERLRRQLVQRALTVVAEEFGLDDIMPEEVVIFGFPTLGDGPVG